MLSFFGYFILNCTSTELRDSAPLPKVEKALYDSFASKANKEIKLWSVAYSLLLQDCLPYKHYLTFSLRSVTKSQTLATSAAMYHIKRWLPSHHRHIVHIVHVYCLSLMKKKTTKKGEKERTTRRKKDRKQEEEKMLCWYFLNSCISQISGTFFGRLRWL